MGLSSFLEVDRSGVGRGGVAQGGKGLAGERSGEAVTARRSAKPRRSLQDGVASGGTALFVQFDEFNSVAEWIFDVGAVTTFEFEIGSHLIPGIGGTLA